VGLKDRAKVEDPDFPDVSDDEGPGTPGGGPVLSLHGVQVDRNKYVSIQRNASCVKEVGERVLPEPVVIRLMANGVPVRALVDTGSLGDFI
jgi:hypothetical protein